VQSSLRRVETLCRQRGARLTRQRRLVLEILLRSPRPLGAYGILRAVRRTVPRAAPPTVYRALEFLLTQGLAHKLETLHAYVGCEHPCHPHASQFLICTECGAVRELEDPLVFRSLDVVAAASGFTADRRIVEVTGTCARCAGGRGDG
jgi:Fur family zinc uptake transcriptional regulator